MISKAQRLDLVLMAYNEAEGLTLEELADVTEQTEICIGVLKDIFQERNGGYGRDGYNREGYNREGYDRESYDREGYDSAGYDSEGYDRSGRDSAGYERDGNY
jgi:hypothetical protein